MDRRWGKVGFAVLAALLLTLEPIWSQGVRATFVGTVRDTSGAIVPKARISVRNLATNVVHTTETDADGDYTVPFLDPGRYSVAAELQGFKTVIEPDVKLDVAAKVRVDFSLEVGQENQTVQVREVAPLVETDTSSVGMVVTTEKLEQLPLLGRNYQGLSQLSPTAIVPVANMVSGYMPGLTVGNYYQVSGQKGANISYTIDGVDANQLLYQSPSILPSLDSIGEYKVQTDDFSAEYGRGTAQFTLATRNGTNAFHGSLYEFVRNQILDATDYFVNRGGGKKSAFNYNQFGGSVGGPVLLPKLYNGKDKTFFFFAYEGTRYATGTTSSARFPDPAWLKGDFSDLKNPDGSQRIIYNPTTVQADPNNPGGYIRQPFLNNQIPPSMFDPVAVAALPFIPAPTSLTDIYPGVNTIGRTATDSSPNYWTLRVDQNFSQRDRMYGRYMQSKEALTSSSLAPLSGALDDNRGKNFMLEETHTFGAKAVNEIRLGYNRAFYGGLQEGANGQCITACKAINYVNDVFKLKNIGGGPITWGLPDFAWSGYSSVGGGPDSPLSPLTNTSQVSDNLIITSGRHSMKMGFDIHHQRFSQIFGTFNRGGLNFNGQFTEGTQPGQAAISGSAFADFLLGYSYELEGLSSEASTELKNNLYGFYFQDDYRVSSKLTLNLGLRYEYYSPFSDYRFNVIDGQKVARDTRFQFGFPPGSCFGYNCPPGNIVTTKPGQPLYKANTGDWGPRVGFSYAPFGGNKTVIRGAYGIFYSPEAVSLPTNGIFNPPSNLNFFLTPTNPYTDLTTTKIDLAFPSYAVPPASQLVTGPNWPLGPISISTTQWIVKDTSVQEWEFTVERELRPNLLLELGYIGSHRIHGDGRIDYNQARLDYPPQLTSVTSRLPYPSLSSQMFANANMFNAAYNAGIVRLERRFEKGLSVIAAYTWAKTIDNTATDINDNTGFWPQNVYNLAAEKGLSSIDARQRLTVGYVWELPYGRGKQFGASINPWLNGVLGGWQVSGITTFQSGNPLDLNLIADASNTGQFGFSERPNIVGPVHYMNPRTTGHWFDPSAFAVPALGTFGDAARGVLIGPGVSNWDLAFHKNFPLKERASFQFRAEMFNAFNHAQFLGVHGTIDPSLAGVMGTVASDRSPRNIQLALRLEF